jgi:hypothetical protein
MADVLRDLWSQQRAWSRAADRAKAEVGRYRIASLLLVVLASGLGTAAPVVSGLSDLAGRISGLAAGVALGLIPLVRNRLGVSMYEIWSRLRSMSEALKVEVYMYLSGVDPYRGEDRTTKLLVRSNEVLERGDDLVIRLRAADRKERPLPAVRDPASYLDLRVEPQISRYYLPAGPGGYGSPRRCWPSPPFLWASPRPRGGRASHH